MVPDALKQRLKEAYADFCSKATPDQRAEVEALLKKAHQQTCDVCQQKEGARCDYPELSHAWSILSGETPPTELRAEGLEAPVLPDGTILGTGKYEQLDVRWLEAGVEWFLHILDRATFGNTPSINTIPDTTTIALAGDWGAESTWTPTKDIASLIHDRKPEFTIHLGDVYYVGTRSAEENQLVNFWPRGSKGTFALNSNHEMYAGGIGLFNVAYEVFNKNLATGQLTHTSYFALENQNWIIVGLDSAFHAKDFYMTGNLNQEQIDWLKQIANQADGRKIIVLSHHQGLAETGESQEHLWSQVTGALGKTGPAYWYWGHVHAAIVYKAQNGALCRCTGHGSIPYGAASELAGAAPVEWYETKSAEDPNVPQRVLNGFVYLTLDGPNLTEEYISEKGETRWSANGSA